MAFPTGLKKEHQYGLDNGVLRSQWARGRFLLTGLCVVRVGGNRQEREKASGQSRVLRCAHNGVRGDNEVEVERQGS